MDLKDVLYGYNVIFDIPDVDIFEYIRRHTDDFLWELGFRPAFSEEKYFYNFEHIRITLTPTSKFTVIIEPLTKDESDVKLEEAESYIKKIADIIITNGYELNKSANFVLVFYEKTELGLLLPIWYIDNVDLTHTNLKEFKTYIEEIKNDKVRITEVTLVKKEKDIIEIKIISRNLEFAKQLAASIFKYIRDETDV